MLSWTERADGWYSNGFRIELVEPHRWVLVDSAASPAIVGQPTTPLAVARSLTECKREAELVAAKRRRKDVQRRQMVLLILAIAVTPFLLGSSSNGNAIVVLCGLVVATRSVTVLLGTLAPRALGEQHEVFYQ